MNHYLGKNSRSFQAILDEKIELKLPENYIRDDTIDVMIVEEGGKVVGAVTRDFLVILLQMERCDEVKKEMIGEV